jgi:hypothetical protein
MTAEGVYAFFAVVWIVVMIWLVVLISRRNTREWQERRRAAAAEKEERMPVYRAAWLQARSSDTVETAVLLQCGDYLLKEAQRWSPEEMPVLTWEVYREILRRLPARPELRVPALDFGRIAYAVRRPGGLPTVYDEQAIQNDILMREGKR